VECVQRYEQMLRTQGGLSGVVAFGVAMDVFCSQKPELKRRLQRENIASERSGDPRRVTLSDRLRTEALAREIQREGGVNGSFAFGVAQDILSAEWCK
jgi:hypothetical protein